MRKLAPWRLSEAGWTRRKVLIVASLLATIPVLAMGASAYFMVRGAFMEEIGLANRQTMLQIQQRIDEKLVTLERVTLQNAVNPTLAQFLSLENPIDDIENFGRTMTLLNSMQVLIQDIDNVYLYRPDKHLVVSPNDGMKGEDMLPEYVREAVSRNPSKVWLDHALESDLVPDGFHRITFVRRIGSSEHSSSGYLIINLNDTAFFRVFSNMQLGSRELLIVTPSGNIFSNRESSLLQHQPDQYDFISRLMRTDADEMVMNEQADGRRMSITSLRSAYNGWKYATIIPYSDLTHYLVKIKHATFLLCILLILSGAAAAGMFSKGWYRPLQSLIELIKNKDEAPEETKKHQNEFVIIRNYFESLNKNNELLDKQIKDNMPLLRINFIQSLLTEPFHSSMIERARYYHIPVKHPYYTVICIELDNMRGHTEQDINLFHYAVTNISREIISHYAEGVVVRMYSGHIAILINHDAKESLLADLNAKSFHIAEEIRSISESLLRITVTMGIGRGYQGLAQVRDSYREALEALEYQLVEGSGRVLFIEQIKPEAASFSYPYEIEQHIITHLKLANLSSIDNLLDEFSRALKAELSNTEYVRQSFAQLIAVSLRSLYELDPGVPQLHEYNLYHHLNELNTTEKIVAWLKTKVYPPIVEHIRARNTHRNRSTIQMIFDHIHQYYDTDLSLTMYADMISMPVSQFSYMFKEEVGINFSEYLIAYRMEKARELLENTDMRISDIAAMLRYNNSQNFIRIFKKINGMTPGEHRSRNSKRNQG